MGHPPSPCQAKPQHATAQASWKLHTSPSCSPPCDLLMQTLEGWACHKLGLLHPAEEAALELVAVAVAASGTASKELDVRSESVGDRPGSIIHARAAFREDSVVSCRSSVNGIAGPLRWGR